MVGVTTRSPRNIHTLEKSRPSLFDEYQIPGTLASERSRSGTHAPWQVYLRRVPRLPHLKDLGVQSVDTGFTRI